MFFSSITSTVAVLRAVLAAAVAASGAVAGASSWVSLGSSEGWSDSGRGPSSDGGLEVLHMMHLQEEEPMMKYCVTLGDAPHANL